MGASPDEPNLTLSALDISLAVADLDPIFEDEGPEPNFMRSALDTSSSVAIFAPGPPFPPEAFEPNLTLSACDMSDDRSARAPGKAGAPGIAAALEVAGADPNFTLSAFDTSLSA
mmetsp:Transcript_39929/g.86072  ORF Transcript_39929/g.86072 Transcript_39929/m.86072 type:complete len:115 (+) Transcript_39929:823-1167(+)